MAYTWVFLAAILCAFAATVSSMQPACITVKTQNIKCSSINYKPAECEVDGVITDVSVAVKHSQSACALGTGFGVTEDKLWVDKGCRATFKVEMLTNECSKTVTCSSINFKPATCPVMGEVLDVAMVTKLSQSACVLDKSYGFVGWQLWVTDGCRATFKVAVRDVCLSVENKAITCSSMNFKPASCPAGDAAVGITMTTKHSQSACVADKSYGLTDGMVWVKDGCRATFNVQYLDDECKTASMKCASINYKPSSCDAKTMILDVTMDTKHSQSACVLNESYGFKGKTLWVDNGCRATFKVKVAED